MKHYHIGLDFGTFQTKACVLDVNNQTHEFFRFPQTCCFFLPSWIGWRADRTFEYGIPTAEPLTKSFHYFKIASAEDEEFHTETFAEAPFQGRLLGVQEFQPFSAEFLSALYLCDVLFTIKEVYRTRGKAKPKVAGFLGKYQREAENDGAKFTTRIGIPTEWSHKKYLRRKRKFENILLIAEQLQQTFASQQAFRAATSDVLLHTVQRLVSANQLWKGRGAEAFYAVLNDVGIAVEAETAAGLTFVLMTRKLLPGYYAIMDVGGGSTDISFFSIEANRSIRYFASESYLVASNHVYRFLCSQDSSVQQLHEKEKEIRGRLRDGTWEGDELLKDALFQTKNKLNKLAYKLFHKRVYKPNQSMPAQYDGQPILVYGGGSRLPLIREGRVEIHDNGNRTSLIVPVTQMVKHQLDHYISGLDVLPADDSWNADLALLIVALGLSYPKPSGDSDWFNDDAYYPDDEGPAGKSPKMRPTGGTVAHPFNQDCYLYDVLNSRWE